MTEKMTAEQLVQKAREILWPKGQEEEQWSPDTLEELARLLWEEPPPADAAPAAPEPTTYSFSVDGQAYHTQHDRLDDYFEAGELLEIAGKSEKEYILCRRNSPIRVSRVRLGDAHTEFFTLKRSQTGG